MKHLVLMCVLLAIGVASADEPLNAPPVGEGQMPATAASSTASAAPSARTRVRGSLYSDAQYQSLTSDRRRFQVGELLTVLVYEEASATSAADTGAGRDSQVSASLALPHRTRSAAIGVSNDFNGAGRTQRVGRVLAQITVLVREVLPNGDLRVSGEQQLEINGEKQTIRAEGRVRPRDVSEQNVVLSSRMAEARLAFVGDGVLGDLQRPRWWQRLLSLFGL